MIREMFPEKQFFALVPYRAYSAATVIALGADAIIMGPRGHLGPIDATIFGYPHSPRDPFGNPLPVSVDEVRKYFELVREEFGKTGHMPHMETPTLQALVGAVSPLALGAVQRTLKATEHDAGVLLRSRLEPKSDDDNDKIVNALACEITYHGHAIFRTEARKLGIDFVKNSEDYGIQDELWQLVEAYMDLFETHVPFEEGMRVVLDGERRAVKEGVPFGVLEVSTAGRLLLADYFCRRAMPPTPQLPLTANIEGAPDLVERLAAGLRSALQGAVPPGSIPTEEQAPQIVMAALNQCLQAWLKEAGMAAVNEAMRDALIDAPVREFWRNRRWVDLDR
jgi:hypothetical protein